MPKAVAKNGKLVIVNLQKTPQDDKASLRIFAKSDPFMIKLMKYLEVPIPEWRLKRRLIISNTFQEGKYEIRMQGVDVDGTPVSFIKTAIGSHHEKKSSWNGT
jgi:hypothetical protein